MKRAIDTHSSHGSTLEGAEENAAQSVAEGLSVTAFERFADKTAISRGMSLTFDLDAFWLDEISPISVHAFLRIRR